MRTEGSAPGQFPGPWMEPKSLAARLALWFTASTFLLVLIATIVLYVSTVRALNIEDSLIMSDKIQTVQNLLEADSDLRSIRERVEKEWVTRKFERVYVKVLDSHGQTITETPDFGQISKEIFNGVPAGSGDHSRDVLVRREAGSGRTFKVEVVRASVPGTTEGQAIIELALDRTSEDAFLAGYRSRLLLVLFGSLVITALIGRRIALRGIRPVSEIAAAVARIRSTTLHERIDTGHLPSELQALGSTFNEMLDRLNESFDRLSRFSQDIAHDLRTPINNLRGELEVALGRTRTPEEYQDTLGSCLEECARLSHLIDNLLFLSRAEDPGARLSIETLDIRGEVLRMTEFFEATASENGIRLDVEIPERLTLQADKALFQRALGNLITNSTRYTRRGGRIVVASRVEGSETIVEVSDTGSGIPAEHLPKVFDRFYRVDPSRSAHSGGTGLGLSIVKGVMTLHRGRVEIESKVAEGTRVRLFFRDI